MILLLLAAAVVYQSSPQRHLAAQGSSAGSDQLYVIDNNFGVGGEKLYLLDDAGNTTLVGSMTSPDCNYVESLGMDTAPDGTVYGMAECIVPGGGETWWGRVDPGTAVFTPQHPLRNANFGIPPMVPFDHYGRFNITFPAEFGAPGAPIGYRTLYNNGTGKVVLYAIDAIAPYREHLVDSSIMPAVHNVSLGSVVSQDGSALFAVTRDAAYRLELQPPQDLGTAVMFFGILNISPGAVLAGIDANGFFSLIDATSWRRFKPTEPTEVTPEIFLTNLNFVSRAFLRRAPLGGVRIEPHEQLTTSESGTQATFTAVLTVQPTTDVTVHFTSNDTSEGTVSPASATFTTANWNTPRTITVTGVLDNDAADQPFTIVTASTSADANYHARGVLDVSVTNTNVNQPPALAPETPEVQQGSPTVTATLGTASDLETAAGSLTVETVTIPTGLTVGTITNTNGTIAAPLTASCSAPAGSQMLRLRVTDEATVTTDQDVIVRVLPNTAPTLGTYNFAAVLPVGSATVIPSAPPGDNVSVSLVEVSSPTFAGNLSVDGTTGTVSLSNAGPVGLHTITIRATDNCGVTFTSTYELVVNTPPELTPGSPSTQQGSPAASTTLGTVVDFDNDSDGGPGLLTVTTVVVPTGVTVGTITNTDGNITAPLSATCSATTGARTLTLRVADGLGTSDQDVTITVLANAAPTLGTYTATTITAGGMTAVMSGSVPADNGTVASVEVSSPTFTGTLSVNPSNGTVSVTNAAPAGVHTVTITATDNCDETFSRTFDLTVDAAPTLTPGSPAARQGSPAAEATLGTVADAESAAGSLTVTAITVPSGVTVGAITNTGGTIAAPLSATCIAATGPRVLTLRVADAFGTTDQDVIVTVLANTAPTLGTYSATIVTAGAAASVTSGAVPADNGTVTSVEVSSPAFSGTLSVNASTGTVSIGNASPAGVHTVTITATDDCGATFLRTFELTVNAVPALTPGTPEARQGSPATGATLGTVSDAETPAGSLTVAAVTVPSGLTVGAISNTAGIITAPLTATCSAPLGPRALTLRVTDGGGATADQDVMVNVVVNTAPAMGAYAAASVAFAGNTTILPAATPADNGTVSLVEVSSSTFTGTLSVNVSGTVSVSNAGPIGAHTVTITATDNCGVTSSTTFVLTVTCPAFSLGAPGAAFTIGGGSGGVAVTAAPGCAWTSSSPAPWAALVNGSGNGNGTATFNVAENRSGAPRSTILTIGGLPFSVTQSLGFADTTIVAGVTPIRAIHLLELRIRIDRLRSRLELPAYGWTDAGVTAAVTPVRAAHVNELRTALLQAYAAVAQPEPAFTNASISSATMIRAVHLNELRAAIIALEAALQLQ